MKFEVTGRHIEVTPALRNHIEEQFQKIDHIFDQKPAKAHVIIEVERGRHRSEIVINWRNEVLTANTTVDDMYQSLTRSVEKIGRQARKLKDKVIDKSHKAKKTAVIATPPDITDAASSQPRIIRANGKAGKPMSPEEAAIKLEDKKRSFVVFRNSLGGKTSVLYKRDDGNFGLIESA
ncbi:MAG: ribosome-associated translation inhibitor RaiA [Acidobacteria bacterium]|nr:ribosome-associated translation inhibitor RaiA [Acidobacteriota bacterium]